MISRLVRGYGDPVHEKGDGCIHMKVIVQREDKHSLRRQATHNASTVLVIASYKTKISPLNSPRPQLASSSNSGVPLVANPTPAKPRNLKIMVSVTGGLMITIHNFIRLYHSDLVFSHQAQPSTSKIIPQQPCPRYPPRTLQWKRRTIDCANL